MKPGLLVEVEEGLTWSTWRATFQAAEQLGFESVWVSDHLCSAWSSRRATLEAWTALAVAAAETRQVSLGTLVSPVMFREPTVLARTASAVQELSGGRLVVGLGLGWNREEHLASGIAFPPVAERARRLEECVARLQEARPSPLRVLIGGAGERWTLPLVARYADEWNVTTSSAELMAQRGATVEKLCREAGRDPNAVARSVAVGFLIGRDDAELRERGRRLQKWVAPLAEVGLEHVPNKARSMGWLVGTPDQVREQMRALSAVGVERVIFGHYDLADTDVLEVVARL